MVRPELKIIPQSLTSFAPKGMAGISDEGVSVALNLNDQHSYQHVTVSTFPPRFENGYDRINPDFLNDWLRLFVDSVRLLYPQFQRPRLSLPLRFQTESIDSDGPYGSSENYYQLDFHSLLLSAGTDSQILISFEQGRHGGNEPICLEATALSPRLSSLIHRPDPRASFHLWHDPSRRREFEALFTSP